MSAKIFGPRERVAAYSAFFASGVLTLIAVGAVELLGGDFGPGWGLGVGVALVVVSLLATAGTKDDRP